MSNEKICTICKIQQNINQFILKNNWCKVCRKQKDRQKYEKNKEKILQQNKEYYLLNKDAILSRNSIYRKNNIEKIKKTKDLYRKNNKEKIAIRAKQKRSNNKETIKKNKKEWYLKNRNKVLEREAIRYQKNKEYIKNRIKEYEKNKMLRDPIFKLRRSISRSIRLALKHNKNYKSIMKYLPYSIEELKKHLESKFEPWMTWENWGVYNKNIWNDKDQNTWTWQIDHIIPHLTFKYISMEEESFKLCWALENLRPISAKQNILDGTKGFVKGDKNEMCIV